jgi:hypothetical protein
MFMPVPKAAVHLNGRMMSWQQDVWASGKSNWVQAVP